MRLNGLDWVVLILVIIGGLNWGLVGLFRYSLVDAIFGTGSLLTRAVYILVGLSALYLIYLTMRINRPNVD